MPQSGDRFSHRQINEVPGLKYFSARLIDGLADAGNTQQNGGETCNALDPGGRYV